MTVLVLGKSVVLALGSFAVLVLDKSVVLVLGSFAVLGTFVVVDHQKFADYSLVHNFLHSFHSFVGILLVDSKN